MKTRDAKFLFKLHQRQSLCGSADLLERTSGNLESLDCRFAQHVRNNSVHFGLLWWTVYTPEIHFACNPKDSSQILRTSTPEPHLPHASLQKITTPLQREPAVRICRDELRYTLGWVDNSAFHVPCQFRLTSLQA